MAYRSILSGEIKGLGMPHAQDVPDSNSTAVSFSDGFPAAKVDQSQSSDQARSQDWDPGPQKLGKHFTKIRKDMYGNWGGIGSTKLVNRKTRFQTSDKVKGLQSGTLWNFPSETGDCSDSPKGWDSDGSHLSVIFADWSPLRASNFRIPVICLPWAYEAVPKRVGFEINRRSEKGAH